MSITPGSGGGRRRELVAAARVVTAREGLGGLTHRAVDREAGLPLGTCSAYLRTSRALRTALATDVVGELYDDVERLAAATAAPALSRADARRLTHDLFTRWLRERTAYLVSLELGLAATRDPDVADLLARWRSRLVEVVEREVRRLGPGGATRGAASPTNVAEMLVAACDGVLAAALARPAGRRDQAPDTWIDLLLDAVLP